jgi:hypothetical protein
MIQLDKQGFSGSVDIEILQDWFGRTHTARFAQLLHPDLVRLVSGRLEHSLWKIVKHGKIGAEMGPEDEVALGALNLVANAPGFLDVIRQITGCVRINRFVGRIYRMLPYSDHYDSWHDDLGGQADRLVGMSVNLGPVPYCGGLFRLADRNSGQVLGELPNTGQGDAILFRISPLLHHMVTRIDGPVPKTAFAGWFTAEEYDLQSEIKVARGLSATGPMISGNGEISGS